jgi:aspartokinase-like uncharacterized kinase
MSSAPVVVKVGGSLFDLPDLGPRLKRWLDMLPPAPVLLVPGGGPTTDVVRALDQQHGLGEEKSHWLALQALGLNAHFLALLLGACPVIPDVDRQLAGLQVLDALPFARADERRPGHLPHDWTVTSDSVAARAAVVAGARRLVLLKSISIPQEIGWAEAERRGWVDPFFTRVVGRELEVEVLNFRSWGL